jgi:hypothetical protein
MSFIDEKPDDQDDGGSGPGMMRRELIALLESASGDDGPSNLRAILQALVDMAKDKEISAIREIFDRVDGKAPTMAPIVDSNRKVIFEWVDSKKSESGSSTASGPNSSASTSAPNGSAAS